MWLVDFDNGDSDEYTYIAILGSKQLFEDNKDREEGDTIVSIIFAVKRAKLRQTQTEISVSYEEYVDISIDKLTMAMIQIGQNWGRNSAKQYSPWGLVSMRRPHR